MGMPLSDSSETKLCLVPAVAVFGWVRVAIE